MYLQNKKKKKRIVEIKRVIELREQVSEFYATYQDKKRLKSTFLTGGV